MQTKSNRANFRETLKLKMGQKMSNNGCVCFFLKSLQVLYKMF